MILLIDNFDSFVHNLARYLRRLGQETLVLRNDAIDAAGVERLQPQAIVLSPGPCTPNEAGCSLEVVRHCGPRTPILGVCLGHQTIGAALGAAVVRAPQPVHGRTSAIRHNNRSVFQGLPNPMQVGRYHSLVVEERTLPAELEVTARTDDGVVMALAHRQWPLVGLQFHPESVLTEGGYDLLATFLRLSGLKVPDNHAAIADELRPAAMPAAALPAGPVTF
jgi:anthranilate synthase/aminodeoxychorismate synthase-like glutamine amidotransferase